MDRTCALALLRQLPAGHSRAQFVYETNHSFNDIRSPGYFAPAAHMLRPRDRISFDAGIDGSLAVGELIVTAVDAAAVENHAKVAVQLLWSRKIGGAKGRAGTGGSLARTDPASVKASRTPTPNYSAEH